MTIRTTPGRSLSDGRSPRRLEYEQGRATLPCPGSEPSGVGRSHRSAWGQAYEVDGLQQCCNDIEPAAPRAKVWDEDEVPEVHPHLAGCGKPELREAGHSAPVPSGRRAGQQ